MKQFLLISLSIIYVVTFSYAQKNITPVVNGSIYYSEVVTVDSSLKKGDLYINAKKFFVDAFHSGKDVIQLDDKESGNVIGKGYFTIVWKANFMYSYEMQIWHTIKVSVKDSKYKYEITDFSGKYFVTAGQYNRGGWQDLQLNDWKGHNSDKVFSDVNNKVHDEISTLKIYMAKKQSTSDF